MPAGSMPLKRRLFHSAIIGGGIAKEATLAFSRKIRILALQLRAKVITCLRDPQPIQVNNPKVFAIVTHVTSKAELHHPHLVATKVDKLKNTIDGLLTSFAHCDLSILINTVPDQHIIAHLPDYQRHYIQVLETSDCDPMYLGFRVQDEFIKRLDDFDWFLFIEDDIVVHDSSFLEKLERFNQDCGYEDAVLLPNRYEMWEGKKTYIDLVISPEIAWNKLSEVEVGEIKFAECANPHSALYCLSRSQLQRWVKSGRTWYNQNLMVGPLESAATFCLLECFKLFKPHPANLHFLEVRHHDDKYSRLYPGPSPYTLSSVREQVELANAQ
jgi:hypothetical protein